MKSIGRSIALSFASAAVPAALLIVATPAIAKRGSSARGQMVEVGPIWNQQDAEKKCTKAARNLGKTWTGQWKTTSPGKMSVCELTAGGRGGRTIEVGPIWNQSDAETKCPKAARKAGLAWTGQWWTTRPGQMSVCGVKNQASSNSPWPKPGHSDIANRTRMVEVGPIWNQADAERKCTQTAREISGTWTGQWKTTRPGQMSMCEIRK